MTLRASEAGAKAVAGSCNMSIELAGLRLSHPIINASGTFDAIAAQRVFGEQLRDLFPFAAFVSKTITVGARGGNAPGRLWETPAGLLNSIGLPNRGLDGFIEQDLPELARLPVPLIVSVAGFGLEEFELLVKTIAARDEVAALELNVSCPNVESGCEFGADPDESAALVDRVRPLTDKALIVKLTPNVADPVPVARAVEEQGADAVSLINTLRGTAVNAGGQVALGAGSGGLSGPAVRPVALAQLAQVSAAIRLPIIGMGGIESGRDALDFVELGACCLAVGTENFRDPMAGERIRAEIESMLATSGVDSFAARTERARKSRLKAPGARPSSI